MSMMTLHEDIILGAIREAVGKIVSGVDLGKARAICQENIQSVAVDAVEIKDAGVCVHEGQPAMRFKLAFSGSFAMVTDLKGNCISVIPGPVPEASSPEQKLEEATSQAAQAHQQF
jgi:hypothetical protein